MKQVISIANVAAQSGKTIMTDNLAAEQLRIKVAQYYGPAITCALFPSEAGVAEELGNSEFKSDALVLWISGAGTSATPGDAERLIMAALLVLLYEGGGHKVTFMLPELLVLLGWPLAAAGRRRTGDPCHILEESNSQLRIS
jgi:dihydroxyacid dehydratase/phosphogluconate dehydratase